jgi:HTH-type transcriptional regulator/antitoxin HipB
MMSSEELGRRIRKRRKEVGLNQADLALTSGTGVRFISDLENGKETCQLGKILKVACNLGFELELKLKGKG